jgi:signal transduction histidine kinase
MRPAELWRHSSFRLALGVTLFSLATLMLASGIGYGLLHAQLTARQDARLTEVFAALQQTSLQGDEVDLIEAITTRITASPDHATLYQLRDASGKTLAGNIAAAALPAGWLTLQAAQLGIVTDYPYRLFTGRAGGYDLTVGLSNADLDDLQEIVLNAFGWAALIALIATFALGAYLAMRVQRQLSQAEAAMARVAQGDLTARLPVTGRGDDLDKISIAINASLARLASLVEAMRQVSADVAHELRTPLNRLRIRIETAADKAAAGRAVEDDLAAALRESETINQTFSALLRIAQIEGGARRDHFAPVDLAAVMTNLAEIYAEVAADAGLDLHCQTEGLAMICGDKDLLTQAFANLIENAIRHCPAGSQIFCRVTAAQGRVVASIADTGPGIPEPERDLVLRRLYRLEKSRTTQGSGLGLSLVKAVADLHSATLGLEDAAPGLLVRLTLAQI